MKKFFIFVLTCIIISTFAITLVGCKDEEEKEPTIGTFVFDSATISCEGNIDSEATLSEYVEAQKSQSFAVDYIEGEFMIDGVKYETKVTDTSITMTVNVEDVNLNLPENSKFTLVSEQYVLEKTGTTYPSLTYTQKWKSNSDENTNYTIVSVYLNEAISQKEE